MFKIPTQKRSTIRDPRIIDQIARRRVCLVEKEVIKACHFSPKDFGSVDVQIPSLFVF